MHVSWSPKCALQLQRLGPSSVEDRYFQPDLLLGRPRSAVNAAFRIDAARWRLLYRCADCALVGAGGACTMGFPNRALHQPQFEAINAAGHCQLCKSFEPIDG